MSKLLDFLLTQPVLDLQEEVIISQRLREHPFTIKCVSAAEMADYSKKCRGKNGFDGEKFNLLLILNHCLEPDFRAVDSLAKAGCATPEELVNLTLKAGEINALARSIYRLSGFDQSLVEMRETVKNS